MSLHMPWILAQCVFFMPISLIASGDVNSCVDDPHNVLGSQFLEILTSSNFSSLLRQVTIQLFHLL